MAAARKRAKTVADFRAAHDPSVIVPNKIRKALEAMAREGKENWEYELDFIKRAGISQAQCSQYREQFQDHVVETAVQHGRSSRRVWFASTKVAASIRGEE